ncbi:hypothetical protein [Nocardia wallacei]|uniref:hypothetical protein n=2 Tax=Nocardia wallacei TaxID=480035 RepID=UPI002455AA28|nr:hypothetical protein [Nocardia wallacei]
MAMAEGLYRVEITETREEIGLCNTRYSWTVGNPEPYSGDLTEGIYLATPVLSGPVTHFVIQYGATAARATAAAVADNQRTLADGAMRMFADQIQARMGR